MSSFKLKKDMSAKDQAKSVGALLIILGTLGGFFISVSMFWLVLLGVLVVIAGMAASE